MAKQKVHAVDFDATLVEDYKKDGAEFDPAKAGDPVLDMVERVKTWLDLGEEVVIFTARVAPSHPESEIALSKATIEEFCVREFGTKLEVTCIKHPEFSDFWDDKAVRVDRDKGSVSDQSDVEDPLK